MSSSSPFWGWERERVKALSFKKPWICPEKKNRPSTKLHNDSSLFNDALKTWNPKLPKLLCIQWLILDVLRLKGYTVCANNLYGESFSRVWILWTEKWFAELAAGPTRLWPALYDGKHPLILMDISFATGDCLKSGLNCRTSAVFSLQIKDRYSIYLAPLNKDVRPSASKSGRRQETPHLRSPRRTLTEHRSAEPRALAV